MRASNILTLAPLTLAACNPAQTAAPPEPPLVRTVQVQASNGATARYTGVIRARTESNLGFRVAGKIFERLVDPGDRVKLGQPLMRLDRTDFGLASNSAKAAVEAARAQMIRTRADEERSRKLVSEGWTSKQLYDQNKAAADAAAAQLAAAEAQASQTDNQASYAELQADADGVVMEVPTEPGQVVAAGQTVVKLARDGAREAEIFLPEGVGVTADKDATAALYADPKRTFPGHLRELSAIADPATRTYRARYVLAGGGEAAPLGATVTVQVKVLNAGAATSLAVPLGALFDDGRGTAVWRVDPDSETVAPQPVAVARLGEEQAEISSGVVSGERIVSLGAHLLKAGQKVRIAPSSMTGVTQ